MDNRYVQEVVGESPAAIAVQLGVNQARRPTFGTGGRVYKLVVVRIKFELMETRLDVPTYGTCGGDGEQVEDV